MFKLSFYVPESHLEKVKDALFHAGAGRYENYDYCCWATLGEGQFRPLPSSKPYIGKQNEVKKVKEYKVEMICEETFLEGALAALKTNHPYEEPAFEFYLINPLQP
ncbi:MAG: hypothetical protein JNL11_19875 [Bdellovibrionaceae bacterium]|nr:hypothetical protein [Pseudobdellovibrionaceae bacterium]